MDTPSDITIVVGIIIFTISVMAISGLIYWRRTITQTEKDQPDNIFQLASDMIDKFRADNTRSYLIIWKNTYRIQDWIVLLTSIENDFPNHNVLYRPLSSRISGRQQPIFLIRLESKSTQQP